MNQFELIRRFDKDWIEIDATVNKLAEQADAPFQEFVKINKEELTGAGEALTRLANVYNLNLADFSAPALSAASNTRKLSSIDMFAVGKRFHANEKYNFCAKWMSAVIESYDPTQSGIDIDAAMDYGSFCYSQIHNYPYAYFLTNEIIRRDQYDDIERIIQNARK